MRTRFHALAAATTVAFVLSGKVSLAQDAGAAMNYEGYSEAPATCCGGYYDHTNANSNAKQIISNFNHKLAAVQLAIIEAMRLGTGQLSGNLREQTGASHTLADQQDDRATVKSIEAARHKALTEAVSGPTSCRTIWGTVGASTESVSEIFRQEYAAALADHGRGNGESPVRNGREYALKAHMVAHCSKFADEKDVASGVCDSVASDESLRGADITASKSIFWRGEDGLSFTLTGDRHTAAKQLGIFLHNPYPVQPLPKDYGKTPEGKEKAAIMAGIYARNSIAEDTYSDILARREPMENPKLKSWAEDNVRKMAGYEKMDLSKGVSRNDWLAIYSRGFLLRTDEAVVSNNNLAMPIKDMRNMMAVLLYQNFENYLLLEKIALNLATQTSILVEQSRDKLPGIQ